MEGIDPRLRDTAPQLYEQHQRQSSNYNGVSGQSAGYDSLQQPSSSNPAGQTQQQHQYYGMPTPGSYSSTAHPDAGGSPYETQGPQNPSDPNDLKRPRACEACRQLKVRCEPDDNSPTGSCRRCAKANRQCVVTAPSRKRQKKTDSRVAELERKIDALTATLHAQRGPDSSDTAALDPAIAQAQVAESDQRGQLYNHRFWQDRSGDGLGRRESTSLPSAAVADGPTESKRRYTSDVQFCDDIQERGEQQMKRDTMASPQNCSIFNSRASAGRGPIENKYIDVIDQQIVDAPTAYRIFDRYNMEMQCLPIVVFPQGTKAEDIRRSKPVLFLAVLSAASNTIRPDLQPTFTAEVLRVLADRIICRGEKTFELVQSLQIVTIFYQPPERYEELNFNQLIHIAVVMGFDIGMGKRSRAGHAASWREYVGKPTHADPHRAETRRAWLGLYFMCANACMSLRRPLLVRWSPYMEESLEILAKAPDAFPSDKWLVHIVQSQHIAEDVGNQFSMDDPPSDVSITQPKIQYQLKTFEKQLEDWRKKSTKDMPQALLKHTEAIMKLYIHEIAMHHSHNVDDFRPPYAVEEENEEEPDYITPAHIDSLTICLDSIHKAFDAFISMPVSTLRSLPTLFFVRNSYAAVALIKMYTAVSAKGSKFGSVFKPEELKVEYYLNAVVNTMNQTAQGGASRVASKFTYIVGILRDWQAKRAAGSLTSKDKGMLSFKSISAGWERHQKQNRQDCQTASWNGAGAAVNTNSKNKPQHSGLQMLSEVAMGDNNNNHNPTPPNNNNTMNNTSSDPTSAALAANATTTTTTTAAQTQAQAPWEAQLAAYTDMHPPSHPHQHSHTGNLPAQDPSAAAAAAGFPPPPQQQSYIPSGGGVVGVGDMDGFTLTAEELGALGIGTMLDDPGWLSFGLESGGWAM